MNVSNAQARHGLSATVTPAGINVSGSLSVGVGATQTTFPSANVAYSLRAIMTGHGDDINLNLATGSTAGSTAWVGGTAQVDTATIVAAGGATSNGTMTLVLTSAGMAGSPLNVPVALTTAAHTTAALIAAAARTALSAVAVVAARFTVGGTGADITLTRLPTSTFTVADGTLPIYPANDATLNLAIPSGLGVTAAATSADSVTGTATDGTKIYDGDGKDIEGVALPAVAIINGLLLECSNSEVHYSNGTTEIGLIAGNAALGEKGIREFLTSGTTQTAIDITEVFSFAPYAINSPTADLTITVIGTTA